LASSIISQEFFCGPSFQCANVDHSGGAGFSESGAISGRLAGAGMGAYSLRYCVGFAVFALLRNFDEVGGAALLFFSASGWDQSVYLHIAALHGTRPVERRIVWRGTKYPLEELRKGMV